MRGLYHIIISDDADVKEIALTSDPAISSNFIAFSNQSKKLCFKANKERKELLGAAMIPGMKIDRLDENENLYQIQFSENDIRRASQLFLSKGLNHKLNIEHTDKPATNCFIFQSFIIDKEKGITFNDLPDGTWVIGLKINNDEIWQKILSGEYKGFSVEGIFNMVSDENIDDPEILEWIEELSKENKISKKDIDKELRLSAIQKEIDDVVDELYEQFNKEIIKSLKKKHNFVRVRPKGISEIDGIRIGSVRASMGLFTTAIKYGMLLNMNYKGGNRYFRPMVVGVNFKGNPVVRGYQTNGFSNTSGGSSIWRMFRIDRMGNMSWDGSLDRSTPSLYNPKDKHMVRIIKSFDAGEVSSNQDRIIRGLQNTTR